MDPSLLDEEKAFATTDKAKATEKQLFGLDNRLTKAMLKLGFSHPTIVQSQSIPLALKGKDLLVRARTGSGKTIAYALPLLQKILTNKENARLTKDSGSNSIQAVVLVPSRELVTQAEKQISELMIYCKDCVRLVALAAEKRDIQEGWLNSYPDIVVSTPGRLAELLQNLPKKFLSKLRSTVETLVVDEADLIFSYGYADDVSTIISHLPKICQSFLMSATLSSDVSALRKLVLHNPAVVKLEEGATDGNLAQWYVQVGKDDKDLLVFALLRLKLVTGKILFFVNTVDRCYRLKLLLEQFHIKSAVLNAELPMNSRNHILDQFNKGLFDYLIATDESLQIKPDKNEGEEGEEVESGKKKGEAEEESDQQKSKKRKNKYRDDDFGVARGVDFRGVSTVINIDFPKSVDSYIHRIGRTARGGASGTALSIVETDDEEQVKLLEEVQKDQPKKINNSGSKSSMDKITDEFVSQPAKLALDLKEIESFRYRVEDVRRAVTRSSVRDARLKEIKQELINSERLKAHFEDNPKDMNLVAHDKHLRPNKVQKSLASIPDYLLPPNMFGQKNKKLLSGTEIAKGINRSPAGRNLWKMRHNKGKYSKKKGGRGNRRGGKRRKDPLF